MIELFEHLKEESGENRVDFGHFGKLGNSGRSNSAIHLTAASPFSHGHGESVRESDFDPNISIFLIFFKQIVQIGGDTAPLKKSFLPF